MTDESSLLALAISALAAVPVCAVMAYRLGVRHAGKPDSAWRKVYVSTRGRGPNADVLYWAAPDHEGHAVLITDEALLAHKVQAANALKHPHTFA